VTPMPNKIRVENLHLRSNEKKRSIIAPSNPRVDRDTR